MIINGKCGMINDGRKNVLVVKMLQWNANETTKKKLGRLEFNKILEKLSKFENESTNGTNISTDICEIEIKEENVTGKGNCKFGGIHLQRNVVDREMIKESKQKPNGN